MTQGDGSTRKREQLSYIMHMYASCESKTQQEREVRRSSYMHPGWQKLCEGTKGHRQKVWTQTKILSPNIRYFVAILRFVAIYAFYKALIEL